MFGNQRREELVDKVDYKQYSVKERVSEEESQDNCNRDEEPSTDDLYYRRTTTVH